ncbi:histone deacetylase complex subunit SAP30 homolog isoform X2 [Crassostrea virginica]|uniref:Histone deacetylase complex subunit SAP30 homolog isoform X2 n=1 Tax=Crassostrea virginica TaxID=6565 RepID=A0A8B8DC00_CRAVI|nr:histone deacetylase complex subunit SAP30 homolog isoform X2 [Crassostrea virginica]XP_022326418.1 histone deacetylase complex subunit SAP30 homolog isoform X2 [Crassostrea virginica]
MFGGDQSLHSYSALPDSCPTKAKLDNTENNTEAQPVSKKRRRKTNLWLHRPKQRNPRPSSPYEGTARDRMSVNGFSTEEDSRQGHDQICCLIDSGDRCNNSAGNASYSKRIQKTVQQRKLKLSRDDRSVRSKRKRKDSEDENGSLDGSEDLPEIDFFQMPVNTLRRYKRHFKLLTRPGMNKAQLADHVARHFKSIPVIEKEALTYFIYMAKNYKSRFDQKHLEHANS